MGDEKRGDQIMKFNGGETGMLKRKKIGVRLADASRGTEEGGWGEWEEGRRAEGGVAREEGEERKHKRFKKGEKDGLQEKCGCTGGAGEVTYTLLEGCGEERDRGQERWARS